MFGQWWVRLGAVGAAVALPDGDEDDVPGDDVAEGDADTAGDEFDVAADAMPAPLAPSAAAITAVMTSRRARMEPPSLLRPLIGRLRTSLAGQADGTLDRGSAGPLNATANSQASAIISRSPRSGRQPRSAVMRSDEAIRMAGSPGLRAVVVAAMGRP